MRLVWPQRSLPSRARGIRLPRGNRGRGDEAFQSALITVAKLLAEHITRDLFAKKLGWREFEFCFNALESRDEMEELQIQTSLLQAGVLAVDEVRSMRGLGPIMPAVIQ